MTESNRQRWYVLGLGAAIVFFVFGAATSGLPVLFSEITDELGFSIMQVGVVWGVSSVASVFSIVAAGFLTDRFGAKRVMAIFCILSGVFGAARGLSDGYLSLLFTSLLFGAAAEPVPVILIKNVSQWFYGRGLGTAQGVLTAFVGGGMMAGAMLSATVLSPWLGGWQSVMFFYGAISALIGIVWFFTAPAPPRTAAAPTMAATGTKHGLAHILRNPGVWLISIAMMGFAGGNRGLYGYLPLYLRNNGWPAAGADGALAALSAAGTTFAIPLTLLSDRLGRRKAVLVPGLALTALGIGLFSVVTGPAGWLLAVAAGIFRDLIWAAAATMTVETEGIGPEYAGTAIGLVHSFARVGYTFAPPAGNALEGIGAGLPFLVWGGLSTMAMVIFLMVRETGRKKG